jgi:hypothetical protein
MAHCDCSSGVHPEEFQGGISGTAWWFDDSHMEKYKTTNQNMFCLDVEVSLIEFTNKI